MGVVLFVNDGFVSSIKVAVPSEEEEEEEDEDNLSTTTSRRSKVPWKVR